MQPQRELAIILRSVPYEERHRIVTAITENRGQVSALARNSIQSRRFGGTLEVFTASEWIFTEKPGAELFHLQEAQIRRSYEGLRKNFDRLSMASVLSELMLKLSPKNEACPDLFKLHANALALLEDLPTDVKVEVSFLNSYLAKLLKWNGNQPQFEFCLECSKPLEMIRPEESVSCIVSNAGWVCAACRELGTRHLRERHGTGFQHALMRVTPAVLRDFQSALSVPLKQIPNLIEASKAEHQDLFKFLEALFIYHIPGFDQQPLKSLRFLALGSNELPPTTNRQ